MKAIEYIRAYTFGTIAVAFMMIATLFGYLADGKNGVRLVLGA